MRFLITLFSLSLAIGALVACGSGGATVGNNPLSSGPGTPGTGTTASPSPSPSPAITGAIYHPPDNGDTFAFAGTLTTTFVRPTQYPSAEPTATEFATVSQAITVTNPATFAGDASAVDFHDVETDAQSAPVSQTITTTTDAYFSFSGTIVTGDFSELGFTSTDSTGYQVAVTYGAGNGLVDILPETAGATWANTPALTTSATSPDGTTAMETINGDGTYTENFVYPNVDAVTNTGTASDTLSGTGSYTTQNEGTLQGSGSSFTLSAPSAEGSGGTITETSSALPSPAASGATPTVTTTTIPNWIPTGFDGVALATETDSDNGATTVPSACNVPAQFGTSANQLVQTKNRVDPTFGEVEKETVTTYVMQTIGPVCTQINDVTTSYYDFTAQADDVPQFSGTPEEITTIAEVVALQSETLDSAARRPQAAQRTIAARLGARVALVESHIVASREIRHLKKMRAFARKGPSSLFSRPFARTSLRG